MVLVIFGGFPTPMRWAAGAFLAASALISMYIIHRVIASRLRTFSEIIITALGMEDRSFGNEGSLPEDALTDVSVEVDALAMLMESGRIDAVKGTALLRTVVAHIAAQHRARSIWRRGRRLLLVIPLNGSTADDVEWAGDDGGHVG